MKNVTVTLPEDAAQWLRVGAAEANRSVSSWLADTVEEMRHREDDYEVAMARALAKSPGDGLGRRPQPTRDELHDRTGLR